MRKKFIHILVLFSLLFMGTMPSCSWIPNPFSKKEVHQKGNCNEEGYLFLKGRGPNILPVLQNVTGQWRLTGREPEKLMKYHGKRVRVHGACPVRPKEETLLLPEIRIIDLTVLEEK